jgi:UDP-N-acetylglucosamine--N-acetylmuramyl-(pentapeptide) pyrophosphoryl-undecaprenol N-acetylglucosamine transferase
MPAGAAPLAELAVAGRPANLVPDRDATDDHQAANARAVESDGAGWLMPEEAFTADAVAARLEALIACTAPLVAAAEAARRRARPEAARALGDAVERLIPGNGSSGHAAGDETRRAAA